MLCLGIAFKIKKDEVANGLFDKKKYEKVKNP
jgi:hypothetical protein